MHEHRNCRAKAFWKINSNGNTVYSSTVLKYKFYTLHTACMQAVFTELILYCGQWVCGGQGSDSLSLKPFLRLSRVSVFQNAMTARPSRSPCWWIAIHLQYTRDNRNCLHSLSLSFNCTVLAPTLMYVQYNTTYCTVCTVHTVCVAGTHVRKKYDLCNSENEFLAYSPNLLHICILLSGSAAQVVYVSVTELAFFLI